MDVFLSFSRTGLSPVSLSLADSSSLVESVAGEVREIEVEFEDRGGWVVRVIMLIVVLFSSYVVDIE